METRWLSLEQALVAYFQAIEEQKGTHPPELRPHMDHLAKVARDVHPSAPPMLQHYLERQSYVKALEFIRGQSVDHQP